MLVKHVSKETKMIKTFNYNDSYTEFSACTYIVGKTKGPCVIIDLGTTSDDVINYIKQHYSICEAIILTHGHFDHIRGIPKFLASFPGTKVYIHEKDAKLLSDSYLNGGMTNGEEDVKLSINPIKFKDEDTLEFKCETFKVIHTPFHTMGSCCFLDEDDNALFTGDTLFKGSIGRTDLPTSQAELIKPSLRKLIDLSDFLVCYPGHDDATLLGNEKRNNIYFKLK